MKLRIEKNMAVVDEQNRIVFFIPEPGPASLSCFNAPASYEERLNLAQEVIDCVNDGIDWKRDDFPAWETCESMTKEKDEFSEPPTEEELTKDCLRTTPWEREGK